MPRDRIRELRRRLYELLEHGPVGDLSVRLISQLLVLLIVVNLIAVALESIPRYAAEYGAIFLAIELVSLIVFTIEYVLRLWVAAENAAHRQETPARARLDFLFSARGLVDLASVLPFWFAFAVPADLRFILVLRIVRFLKLARYSPAMRSLLEALYAERRALFGCLVILLGAAMIAAAVMHLVEHDVQPDKFGTIPDAMWWAIVTLGTIGYGDVVPITPIGKMVATVTIFGGLVMIALPVGIIANAFAEQIHRRDFVVTWSMIARVPLFAGLQAADIADVMRLLRAQTVDAGSVIVRRGDPAHSMYFVAGGEVEIELKDRRLHFGVGHFFGEIAVLRRARRSGTAIALTRANLLVLDAADLHALMERDHRIAHRINEVVRDRIGGELVSPKGDIVTEEIE